MNNYKKNGYFILIISFKDEVDEIKKETEIFRGREIYRWIKSKNNETEFQTLSRYLCTFSS